jgi:phosphopantothenoylcysteine decarboxylase/phosphopantothenate--cysteine ligase
MSAAGSLVLIATGSSAAIILPAYLTEIRARTALDITVVMTATAQRFVRPEVVGWFAQEVITPESVGVNPIELALGATAIVVLPASGNTIASAALGLMPTQATTVIGASPRPCLYFPQMHEVVWHKRTMVAHVAALREGGDVVVEPDLAPRFEISRGETRVGLSMPGPAEAAQIIHSWLQGDATPARAQLATQPST